MNGLSKRKHRRAHFFKLLDGERVRLSYGSHKSLRRDEYGAEETVKRSAFNPQREDLWILSEDG
jgi:hypothetical protein